MTMPDSLLQTNAVIRELLTTRTTRTPAGESLPLGSCIDANTAEALYRQIRAQKPRLVVEVGMANAISSLAILTALAENGGAGQLISIDPNQSTQWRDCGRASVARAGLSGRHRVIEKPDSLALPQLLEEGLRVDFGYIDGWHTFDYALVDFWYLDKMVPKDGVVAFNDCGWPAVEHVIRFVQTHRRYREIDVGLARSYDRPLDLMTLLRRIKYRRVADYWRRQEDRYFVKTEAWEPRWDFYAKF
jgi:predicted O-methyltransferase YrrM